MTALERAREIVAAHRVAVETLGDPVLEGAARLADTIAASIRAGGKVWLFGNGGSAADAQHLAAELVGRFAAERRGLPAEALTVNTSVLTAVANDYGFSEIFARQLEAHARAGDVAIAISTSGTSENVLRGLETALKLGLATAVLTGESGVALGALASECIVVPTSEVARIQECHILIGHIVCELVERAFT